MNRLGHLGVGSNTSPIVPSTGPGWIFSFTLRVTCVRWYACARERGVFTVKPSVTPLRRQWRFDLYGHVTTSCHHLLDSKWKRTQGWTASICVELTQTQSCWKLSVLLEGRVRCLYVSSHLSELCFSSASAGWRTSCGTLSLAPQRPYLQPARNLTNA